MRIAIYHNLPTGGAKRSLREWTKRLNGRHEFIEFCLSTADRSFCDLAPYVRESHVFEFSPRRLFAKPFGRLNQWQRWLDLGELNQIGKRVAAEIDGLRMDAVFAHPCMFTTIPLVLNSLQTPSLYYLHEPFGPGFQRSFSRPYLSNSPYGDVVNRIDFLRALNEGRQEALCKSSLVATAQLVANSRFTQQWMLKEYDVQSTLCALGVDSQVFHPQPELTKENCVISVGELTPRKGFDFIIESLGRMATSERPSLKIASNWSNPAERQYLVTLANKHGVQLDLLGRLDTEELVAAYNRALLCVYAPIMEPLGLVPLEAMACGLPVVGVAEAGVLETVVHGETGLLVARSADEFAQAVRLLVTQPDYARTLAEQARRYVEQNWNWDQSAASIEQHLLMTAASAKRR